MTATTNAADIERYVTDVASHLDALSPRERAEALEDLRAPNLPEVQG